MTFIKKNRWLSALLAISALVSLLTMGTHALFTDSEANSGNAVSTDELSAASLHAPTATGGNVSLDWDPASLGNDANESQITYSVERQLNSGSFAPASTECTDTAETDCDDTVTESGSYTYRVIATFRTWTAESNTRTIAVTVGGGDTQAPTVQSINRSNPAGENTNASSVTWRVTFSEDVTGVDASDFALAPTVTGAGSISVSPVSGSTYDVSANTGTGNGTLGLDLVEIDNSIKDAAGNDLGGNTIGDGNFTNGETYAIDKTSPAVQSINRNASSPTNTTGDVSWTVVFTEPVAVAQVTAADLDLVPTGLGGAPAIATVTAASPSGGFASSFTVTASTGTGSGSLGLDLDDDDSIVDAVGNALVGPLTANGDFVGQVYAIDRTGPTVALTNPGTPLSGTVALNATASDPNGVQSVIVQRAPTGTTTWTTIATCNPMTAGSGSSYSCSFNTTTVSDGGYDLRAVATDTLGNTANSATVANRVIDNPPFAADITTNQGNGEPAKNDTITFTYSETMKPTSILSGWTGAETDVWVKITDNGNDDILTVCAQSDTNCNTPLPLTNANGVHLGGNYVTATARFGSTGGGGNRSKMTQNGAEITVSLGQEIGSGSTTGPGAGASRTLVWNPSSSAQDTGNNACSTTSVSISDFTAF